MRVLHIITGLADGGAESVLYHLCTNDRCNQHTIISLMDEGRYGQVLRERGFRVISLGMPRGKFRLLPLWRLWRLIRRERFDLVQTWMYHADLLGGVVARLAGQRRLFWGIRHSGLDPVHSARSTILIARLCARLSCWLPSGIICCAEKAAQVHREMGYCADKMKVIPNGYDLSRWNLGHEAGVAFRRSLGIPEDTFLVGMVGRLDAPKHHENLLNALTGLRDREEGQLKCLLAGSGITRDNPVVDRWLETRGLEDVVMPLGARDDIPALMAALDLHVLASRSEGFPNVVAEAMASGTPCVVTDVGDAALIVGQEGWVVPPCDSQALAAAIAEAQAECRQQPQAWHARRQRGRQRIRDTYGVERMVEAYTSFWHSTPSANVDVSSPLQEPRQ